ncbi:MAG TPA: DUF1194 domain-containing protein [Alphaproteobacteria bacterium]|nr:DUF1194 domain-containing protein [Alphaproteobacteria bacterium]
MRLGFVAIGLLVLFGLARPAAAATPVDLTLVLAVDVSLSMAEDEAKFQRHGYAQALRDPQVIDAINSGTLGKIAIIYIEWSSVTDQRVLVDWQEISDKESAEKFAAALDKAPFKTGTTTSISAGIDFAVKSIAEAPFVGTRKVIDVSGDGYSDYGRPVRLARDEAVASGITINGLPVMNPRPAWRENAPPDLDRYYADNVIGGPASFYLVVKDIRDFGKAVVRKMILEIAQRNGTKAGPG